MARSLANNSDSQVIKKPNATNVTKTITTEWYDEVIGAWYEMPQEFDTYDKALWYITQHKRADLDNGISIRYRIVTTETEVL